MTAQLPNKAIDIGCGPNKKPGSYGVDCFAFPGVDQVFEFEQGDWPLPDDHFESVHCSHVIEHMTNAKQLLRQIHRICRAGAEVYIETPHFSCIESWSDPTHMLHLSARWYGPLLKGQYLASVVGEFELIRTEIVFHSSFRGSIAKALAFVFGRAAYERYYAFAFPALNVKTWLRVCK
jgi:SAM-dependent methyltransferase